jgi:hypothetical protein
MGSESDVDLLVIKAGVPHRRKLAQAIYMGLSGVGAAVDVIGKASGRILMIPLCEQDVAAMREVSNIGAAPEARG